jgi:hypothetical protein
VAEVVVVVWTKCLKLAAASSQQRGSQVSAEALAWARQMGGGQMGGGQMGGSQMGGG